MIVAHIILGTLWVALSTWFHGVVPVLAVIVPAGVVVVAGRRLSETDLIRLVVVVVAIWLAAGWLTVGNSVVVGIGALILAGLVGHAIRRSDDEGALARIAADPNSLVLWLILGVLIGYGFQTDLGAYFVDPMHPLYELSIGNSYARGILDAPDLSLAGKSMRFHFLSTQSVRLIRAMGIAPIAATYFVVPSILAFLGFIVVAAYFSMERVRRYTAFLLFVPVVIVMERSLYFETSFRRFFAVTPSFSMGIILTIAFYVEVVVHRRYLAGWILSVAVLLTKATFFPVIAGALVLRWFFRERRDGDHRVLPLLGAMAVTFGVGYVLFFSGAHSHNHWLVGPSFLYRLAIEGDVVHAVSFLGVLALVAYRIRKGMITDIDWFAISGILGTLVIAEITEEGSYQFYTGGSPFLLVIAARTLAPRLPRAVAIAVSVAVIASSGYILRGFVGTALAKVDGSEPLVSNAVIDAYDFLDGEQTDGVVYFPPVYELETAYSGSRYSPDTGFLRSALADRPFYRENFKYKGIAMQPEFIDRFGTSLFWYERLFEKTPDTAERFDMLLESTGSYERGEPFSPDGPLHRRMVYYAGLGTEWSWFNWRYVALHDSYQLYRELEDAAAGSIDAAPDTEAVYSAAAREVSIDPRVGIVVSERGDTFHPPVDSTGRTAWEQIWADGDVTVWARR